jgi:hypothetical protein
MYRHTHTQASEIVRSVVSTWSSDSAALHLWPTFFHSWWKKIDLWGYYAVCVYMFHDLPFQFHGYLSDSTKCDVTECKFKA